MDSLIPCEDDQDCPENKDWWIDEGCRTNGTSVNYRKCETNNLCSSFYYDDLICHLKDDDNWELSEVDYEDVFDIAILYADAPHHVSAAAALEVRSSCKHCKKLQNCPPDKPCTIEDGKCARPYCTRRGRCWCPSYY